MRMILKIMILSVLTGCAGGDVSLPVLLHRPDTLSAGRPDSMVFAGMDMEKAGDFYLQTTRQPFLLSTHSRKDTLVVSLDLPADLTEGNGWIHYSYAGKPDYFPLYLSASQNRSEGLIEYRSPKTVNPDSSLFQQRIRYRLDAGRNLLPLVTTEREGDFFSCDTIKMPARAGIYPAADSSRLKAVYVQAGSPLTIAVSASFDKEADCFVIRTSLMKDRFENPIADGTLVVFEYRSGGRFFRREVPVRSGVAMTRLPANESGYEELRAGIGEMYSRPINLLP